jgi:acetyltransferase
VRDPSFGPVVVLGMGGIYAEALRERTCRLAPVDADEARAMVAELGCASVLRGVRGQPPFDVEALVSMIVAVSRLAWAQRETLSEIDVNPVFVRPQGRGAVAADALLIGGKIQAMFSAAFGRKSTACAPGGVV